MQYQCPKCQSRKILPVASANEPAVRPVVPKSLVFLIPLIFILLLLVVISIFMMIFGNGADQTKLQLWLFLLPQPLPEFYFGVIFLILKFQCNLSCKPIKSGNAVIAIINGKFNP